MIHNLRLQNFKCFADQALDLGAVTILSGLNGMGKSSVIQSLLVLRQSFPDGERTADGLVLNGDLVHLGTAKDVLFSNASEDVIGLETKWKERGSLEWLCRYDREADVLSFDSAPATSALSGLSLFSDRFQYLQAERIGPRAFYETADNLVRHRHQLGTRGEFGPHFLDAFYNQPVASPAFGHPAAASLLLKDQVEAWLGEVSPGVRITTSKQPGMDIVRLGMSFVTKGDVSNEFRPTNVGFGLSYVMPVLISLLASPSDALILLENPEAHLHPRAQSRIGELIGIVASAGRQVIVETHSDHLLNGLRLAAYKAVIDPSIARIHFFQRHAAEKNARTLVVSPQLDRNGRFDCWPDGFFDEWEKSLERLLTERGADNVG